MESGSRSSRGFDEEDEDEEGTSKKVELTVRVDRGNDQRSKHSAMEQRRRSKINERFQMLRELIPHGDQKRDKASFLLEVIEYIRFLQEKVQKYESSYPAWNDENTKSMPWPNYASVDRGAGVTEPQSRLILDIDDMASQSQTQWLRPSCTADYNVSSDTSNEQHELAIDEGTINISTAYSHNILNVLNQALESSGVDLSQSNISVQIKLGRRATRRETATTSSAKDQDVGEPRVGSSIEESVRAPKRSKAGGAHDLCIFCIQTEYWGGIHSFRVSTVLFEERLPLPIEKLLFLLGFHSYEKFSHRCRCSKSLEGIHGCFVDCFVNCNSIKNFNAVYQFSSRRS